MGEVSLRQVTKRFGDVEIIKGVDIDIENGEFTVFVGPSGCGKSTLLRLIAGLEEITSGELRIGGELVNNVPPAKRGIAMVFQSYALYPQMTVRENMGFALKLAGASAQEQRTRIEEAARILQIEPLLERKPGELSGGQRQRVAIGRAIVRKPKVFLFDEPLSNLDASLRVQTRSEISRLHSQLATTMVYVTHDQVEAMTMADKIVVLDRGSVAQTGSPMELYHHPRNLFVAGFIGSPSMNLLSGELLRAGANNAAIKLTDGTIVSAAVDSRTGRVGSRVTLGIRPEHCTEAGAAGDGTAALSGTVAVVERLGELTLLYLELPGTNDHLVVRAAGNSAVGVNAQRQIGIRGHQCHVFDEHGEAFPRLNGRLDRSA